MDPGRAPFREVIGACPVCGLAPIGRQCGRGDCPGVARDREIIASMMEPKSETHEERVERIRAVDHPPVLCGMDSCPNLIYREFAGSKKGFCDEHWNRLYVLMKAMLREDATLTDTRTIAARARQHAIPKDGDR